jgi:hypothetical protein
MIIREAQRGEREGERGREGGRGNGGKAKAVI